uniref:non-specific serine/threonine protein kinase n=1 Tax=Monopterus albus TaxID=43700 RepID=A0A3Q3IN24_MONAL
MVAQSLASTVHMSKCPCQQSPLGERSHGSVYTHYRRVDRFCMAIKHIPRDNIICKGITQNRRTLHFEAVMRKVASGAAGSVVKFSAICLLDYYDLELGLILVLEFPLPSVDLCKYIDDKGESLQEEVRLIFKQNVFHRDIEVENILIETTSNVPFLMLIDLWLCYFTTKTSSYMIVHSTSAHIPTEWYRCCSSREARLMKHHPYKGVAEGGTRQQSLIEVMSLVMEEAVKHHSVLPIVLDHMVGYEPPFSALGCSIRLQHGYNQVSSF